MNSADAWRAVNGVDRVIHEPARLMIVSLLYLAKEADFVWLHRQTELTKGNLSAHIAKLEEAGYLEVEKGFHGKIPRTMLRLTKAGRKSLEDYRKTLRAALAGE